MTGTCETCRYFAPPEGDWPVGECRRRAPVILISGFTTFPATRAAYWCGEWSGAD